MRRIISFALALFIASPAVASVVERMDLGRLVEAADAIVVGTVLTIQSSWQAGRIVTRVQVRTQGALKGAPGSVVEVEVFGGEVDGVAQKVAGMASFRRGEQVALFLERAPSGAYRTVGAAQGKLRIELAVAGVQVVRTLDGLTLVERDPAGALVPAKLGLPAEQRLGAFLADLSIALDPR